MLPSILKLYRKCAKNCGVIIVVVGGAFKVSVYMILFVVNFRALSVFFLFRDLLVLYFSKIRPVDEGVRRTHPLFL